MNGMLVVTIILIVSAVLVGIISKRNNSASKYNEMGIPFGLEDKYQLAINPCSDGKPLMFDLTTCRHCVRVQDYLAQHHVEINDIVVDRYIGKAREEILKKLREYNPKASFPTVVFPDGTIIVGYREGLLKEAVENYKNNSSQIG